MLNGRMKQVKTLLKNVKVDRLERTLDKCLAWFYANPSMKIGLTELARLIKSSKTAAKQVVNMLVEKQERNRFYNKKP